MDLTSRIYCTQHQNLSISHLKEITKFRVEENNVKGSKM